MGSRKSVGSRSIGKVVERKKSHASRNKNENIYLESTVSAALVLKFIRDKGPVFSDKIRSGFGISEGTCPRSLQRAHLLSDCMTSLCEENLIVRSSKGYIASDLLKKLQDLIGFSLSSIVQEQNPTPMEFARESKQLQKAARLIETSSCEFTFKDDLVATIREIEKATCHQMPLTIHCLCGKVLEITLKQVLVNAGIKVEDNWMLGTLLSKMSENLPEINIDHSLKNVANIINQSRISAIHAKENIPVPSMNQALMTLNATLDVLERLMFERIMNPQDPSKE
jgi:hypothetical protein